MAIAPVCGMSVEPAKAAGRFEHAGKACHFRLVRCWFVSIACPGRFLARAAAAMSLSSLSVIVNSGLLKRVNFSQH